MRLIALVWLVLLALPAGAAAAVEEGTVAVNRGAAGILLGMTRAEVVATLGEPLYENDYGYMEYSEDNLFDLYRRGGKVDLIGMSGPRFCTKDGICCLKRHVGKLQTKFGSRLRLETAEDGSQSWVVRGRVAGKRVFTAFDVDGPGRGARILMIWVGYRH